MKNVLIIDVDTERTPAVKFLKDRDQPQSPEEAKKMVIDDISCACEGLCGLIHIADQNKYGEKKELVTTAIKYLNDMLKVTPS